MLSIPANFSLNCTLTRYLEEASSTSNGGKAALSSAMLADIGFLIEQQGRPDASNLKTMFGTLISEGYITTLTEMTVLCKGCQDRADCGIGAIVLSK